MQILVTGSNGQLGSELRDISPMYKDYQFLFTDVNELDITSPEAISRFFKGKKIDCVINCAGYTAVDQAESDATEANLLNGRAAGYLAEAASKAKALMIHISTDYVFDGKNHKPYTENDSSGPKTAYGKSKLNGEVEVIFNASRSVIIRTSWLYSSHGHNFVKTILSKAQENKSLRVVYDQIGTPTYAADLAKALLDIIPRLPSRVRGEIYNYSNEGVCSWYDFALAIIEMQGINCAVTPVQSKEFKTAAARPHYSVLDKARFRNDFGLEVPHWRNGLMRCLEKM
jgi:dTDP-4-dehydrorhamnose reductase